MTPAFLPDGLWKIWSPNRPPAPLFARACDIAAAEARRRAGEPLRLLSLGRLERADGAHHLVPVMKGLLLLGLNVTLDVYGTGSCAEDIQDELLWAGLHDRMSLHLDPEHLARLAGVYDLFLSCRLGSGPCRFQAQALGLGLPIIGYENRALAGLLARADMGWLAPAADPAHLVQWIVRLDANRREVDRKARAAYAYALKSVGQRESA